MSKQINSRPTGSGGGNRPNGTGKTPGGTNRHAAGPSRPVGAPTTSKQPVRSGATGQPVRSTGARTQSQKSGFRVRPLDMALVAVGVLLVGALIWGGLNGATSKPAVTPATTVAAGVGSSTVQPQSQAPVALEAGKPAPDFNLPATDGQTYTLGQFKGKKAVLLEFMAPWCPHCQADAPEFAKVYNNFKDKDVQVLGISATPLGKDHTSPIALEDLTWFRDKFGVPYPLLFDPSLKVANSYGIEYFPTAFVIDKNGVVSGAHMISEGDSNPLDANRMIGEVNKVLR